MTSFFNPKSNVDNGPVKIRTQIISDVLVVAGLFAVFGFVLWLLPGINQHLGSQGVPEHISIDMKYLPYYAMRSVFRMMIALVFSLIFSYIYGLLAARTRLGRVLIPFLDILQSVPILGFLSATITIWLVLFPNSMLGVEAASIFAIFTSQAWNMAFSFHRSLLSEPEELDEAARSLRLTRWQRFWKLDVPNSMIPMLWNCMMSVGGGWFFLTASEMISVNNKDYALPGLGSFVSEAADHEDTGKIGWAIVAMILIVLILDGLLWKPMTAWAEKFRISQSDSTTPRRSLVLTIIRYSHLNDVLSRALRPVNDFLDRIMNVFGRTGARWAARGKIAKVQDIVFDIIATVLIGLGLYQLVISILRNSSGRELANTFGLGGLTFLRVTILIILCSIIWVPIGAVIGMNPKVSRFMQPIVQILASFPANFTFPFVTIWFIAWNINLNWGCILLMALGTQWYILFNVIAGASAIPDDLRDMSSSIQLTGWLKWKRLILPSVFGAWCTGGITAAGGAWNASIVSEVVSYGHHNLVATGLGSYISDVTEKGDMPQVIIGVAIMSVFVVILNKIFWTPLHNLANRRFTLN